MYVNDRYEKLKKRAIEIGGGAIRNLRDAKHDLCYFPMYTNQILDDFEQALNSYPKEGEPCEQ